MARLLVKTGKGEAIYLILHKQHYVYLDEKPKRVETTGWQKRAT